MSQGAFDELREPPAPRTARLVTLKPYDIRHDHERATRRHLAQRTRGLLRVGTLLVLDASVALGTLALALLGIGLRAEVAMLLLPVAMLSLLAVHAYGPGVSRADGYARLLAIIITGIIVALQAVLLEPLRALPAERLVLWLPLFYAGLEGERALVGYAIGALRRRNHLLRPALVIGSPIELELVCRELAEIPHNDLQDRKSVV